MVGFIVYKTLVMKKLYFLLLIILGLGINTASAVDYVSVVDDCPYLTFTGIAIRKVSIHRQYVRVDKVNDYVVVSFLAGGGQQIKWDSAQANAYGGRTVTQLYEYILSLITTNC